MKYLPVLDPSLQGSLPGGIRHWEVTARVKQAFLPFFLIFFDFVRIFIFLFKFGCLFLCHLRSTWCEHACSPLASSRASLRNAGFETELNELNELNLAIELAIEFSY